MCSGAEIATVAGTAAQQYGENQTRRDLTRAAQQREEQARQLNERAGSRVSQQVQDLKTSTDEAGKADETKLQTDFMDALRRSQLAGGGTGLDSTPGATSGQYNADAATARQANASGNRAAATNLARIDAPFMQRVREATGSSRLTSDLSRIDNQGRGQDFLSQLRMSLISPNSGLDAAGSLLQGYGDAASKRAPKTKKPSMFSQLPDQTEYSGVPS